ncbi:DEAD/DEAH box helicase [Pseudahrensia aquimaris]|uniref:DEAD/DEAH box helicase n=1 Tax=Pseudahrensia aquimaris TaxID=744461 RepID=A0ABW3FHM6_9HYPH
MTTFNDLGLAERILDAAAALDYVTPTPIQEQAIPLILKGHDIMGLAKTGTGKTAAFGLPLVQNLMSADTWREPTTTKALILAPTRELANQIAANLRSFTKGTHIRITVVVGGASLNVQTRNLSKGTDILVATPGRLLDLVDRKAVRLDQAKFLVLDEADQMLDMGFIHDLRKISKLLATPRQTLLFSATMPKLMEEISRSYLRDPVRVETAPPGQTADKIRQSVHFMGRNDKLHRLDDMLREHMDGISIVFARTKHGAEKLKNKLVEFGYKAASIHGNKSQGQRDRAIREFKDGTIKVLVATDVAARGIDIPDVSHVYNFDLPEVPENYIHRIGRTARAGKGGEAIAFCTAGDVDLWKQIERLVGISIPVASGERPKYDKAEAPQRGGGGGNRGGNRSGTGGGKAKAGPSRKRIGSKPNPSSPKKQFARGADGLSEEHPSKPKSTNRRPGRDKPQEKPAGLGPKRAGEKSVAGKPKGKKPRPAGAGGNRPSSSRTEGRPRRSNRGKGQ